YWLGRYAERAEGTARLGRIVAAKLLEAPADPALARGSEIAALLRALAAQAEQRLSPAAPPIDVGDILAAGGALLCAAVVDAQHPGSVAALAQRTLTVARAIRERLSSDTWRVLSSLDTDMRAASEVHDARPTVSALAGLLDRTVLVLAAFSGLGME